MTPPDLKRNRLSEATSPYLQQHAENPVHWQLWSNETLDIARSVNKPILLSIGYAACHWCHVMAHESFEDPETAELMNNLFVNIKVDREERPDIDQIYMAALHAMGQQGGWPLTMFLMPTSEPFYGGTYFPPEPAHGRPSFREVLVAVERAYRNETESISSNAAALTEHIHSLSRYPENTSIPEPGILDHFAERALKILDTKNGGIRGAPKFPNAPLLEHWSRASRGKPESSSGKAFIFTLEKISQGGIYDHLAGGIARYTVDEKWLVPHFEKMLYDNAHYVRHLVLAWLMTGKELFRRRIEETISWMLGDLLMADKAFASSYDADSEGEEGKYYVWSRDEIARTIGSTQDTDFFCDAYNVTEKGNWEGKNILNQIGKADPVEKEEERLKAIRTLLLKDRARRTPPGLDDKILTDWNGYAIRAIAEAAAALKRTDWLNAARSAFDFITESISDGMHLPHAWKSGRATWPAVASDYGAMMNAALTLYENAGEEKYFDLTRSWASILEAEFSDQNGGYYLTSTKCDDLSFRPRCDQDEANPAAAAQILEAQVRLANISGDSEVLQQAHNTAACLHAVSQTTSHGMAGFMNGLHSLFHHRHITVFASGKGEPGDLEFAARQIPDLAKSVTVLAKQKMSNYFGTDLIPPNGQYSAIVCSGQTCSMPLRDADALRQEYWKTSG